MLPVNYIQVAGSELFHKQVVESSEHAKNQKGCADIKCLCHAMSCIPSIEPTPKRQQAYDQ